MRRVGYAGMGIRKYFVAGLLCLMTCASIALGSGKGDAAAKDCKTLLAAHDAFFALPQETPDMGAAQVAAQYLMESLRVNDAAALGDAMEKIAYSHWGIRAFGPQADGILNVALHRIGEGTATPPHDGVLLALTPFHFGRGFQAGSLYRRDHFPRHRGSGRSKERTRPPRSPRPGGLNRSVEPASRR